MGNKTLSDYRKYLSDISVKYFGQPGKGIHSYRIFNIAYIDVILTIICAVLLSYILKIPAWVSIIGVFLFGIFIHRFLYIKTTVDKKIFD